MSANNNDGNLLSELFASLAGPAPEEASSDAREGGRALRQMYAGMVSEGFPPQQALYVLGVMLGTQAGQQQ